MRLLQVSLRSLLIYSLVLVVLSIPVSLFSIREILRDENDASLALEADEFLKHIKGFEYLEDLETDLEVLDNLSYNTHIKPHNGSPVQAQYETVLLYDSLENKTRPFRQLSSTVNVKSKLYLLTVRTSLVDNTDLILAIVSVQAILIVLLAGGLLFLNRSLSRNLWKPFYNTLNQLKAYELDKTESIVASKTDIVEFDDLNKTVSHLTDRNRKVFLQQKEFLENASHELQTPLAIFQSNLDQLMQSPTMSASDASLIEILERTAQRMARLNKNLLFLSKIDNDQFTGREDISLPAFIETLKANLQPMAATANISIQTAVDSLVLSANKTLLEVLLTNLLHNAIRYSPHNGVVSVILKDRTLTIKNSGKPMRLDSAKIFDRFVKDSDNPNSTGLGLAIAKEICESCNYLLKYEHTGDAHAFSVTF